MVPLYSKRKDMASKKNMAIIGVASAWGMTIAEAMAASYDLLLMDTACKELTAFINRLRHERTASTIEILECCREASWEADVIVVTVSMEQLPAIAEKIREVTTRKPVIHFTSVEADAGRLQTLLPHANVIDVVFGYAAQEVGIQQDAWIRGNDEEALKVTREILAKSFCKLA